MCVVVGEFLFGFVLLSDLSSRFPISEHMSRTEWWTWQITLTWEAPIGVPSLDLILLQNRMKVKLRDRNLGSIMPLENRGLDFIITYFTGLSVINHYLHWEVATYAKLWQQRSHKLYANFSRLDKFTPLSHLKFDKNPVELKHITESVLLYKFLGSKWFANLDCKVCSNGKVEDECFRGFHPICYVNQSRRFESQKKPSTFASTWNRTDWISNFIYFVELKF